MENPCKGYTFSLWKIAVLPLRDRDRDDVTTRGQLIDIDIDIDGTFPLTFEGNFMIIPPLVGLDLDTISRRLPYLA